MRSLHWFRKDLRLDDNAALSEAVHDAQHDVVPFYASDPAWFARGDIAPTRVRFVLGALTELSAAIAARGSRLALAHGDPAKVVLRAARAVQADAVYWNDEYEPAARARDERGRPLPRPSPATSPLPRRSSRPRLLTRWRWTFRKSWRWTTWRMRK